MSVSYSYPGQAYSHTLTPLKGWYEYGALDAEVKPSTNVNINSLGLAPLCSGLVVHATDKTDQADVYGGVINGPGTLVVELGCGGLTHGIPMYLWPGFSDPDISNPGTPTGTPAYGDSTYGPPDQIPVYPPSGGGNMTALVATGGFEVETTEYDADQTYASGQPLRAVTSNTNVNGGKVTNQGASANTFTSSQTFLQGDPTLSAWDTIVGVVSRETYTNANKKPALSFYTAWIPGTR